MALSRGFPPSNLISPSVRIREVDLSFIAPARTTHRCGLVGFASKGPINIPTLIRSHRQLWTTFGFPHPQEGDPYLIYAAQQYLLVANELFVVRVGDTDLVSDEAAGSATVDVPSSGGQIDITAEVAGAVASEYFFDFDVFFKWKINGLLASKTLVVLASGTGTDFVAGYTAEQLAAVLNDQLDGTFDGVQFYVTDANELSIRTTFAFGLNSELELISVLDGLYGGAVSVRNGWDGSSTNNFPGLGTGMTRAVSTSAVDGYTSAGTGGPTAGEWDFTGLTNQTINIVVDGTNNVTIDNVLQVIDLDDVIATAAATPIVTTAELVAEINAQIGTDIPGGFEAVGEADAGLSGEVTAESAADTLTFRTLHFGRGARILVKADSTTSAIFEFDHETDLGLSPLGTAGHASEATYGRINGSDNSTGEVTVTINADSPGIEGNNTSVRVANNLAEGNWSFQIYSGTANVESWGGLSKDETSRFYVGTFIDLVSDYIRISDNTDTAAPPANGDYTLVGGSDGIPSDPDAQDGLLMGDERDFSGMWALSEPEQIDIDILAVPGHPSTNIALEMIRVVEARQDAMAIIDPPFGLTVKEIIDWQNGNHPLNTTRLDSDFAALYWPWVKYRDFHNKVDVWIPPSGGVTAVYARNDNLGAPWMAPAGLTRGMVPSISDVFSRPTLSERDDMYGSRNAINPIVNFADVSGFVVWGQKTLQRAPTALDRVNVRRLMFYIEKEIRRRSKRLLFEPHDEKFRAKFTEIATEVLQAVVVGRGITEFIVRADDELNTPETIDRNEFYARIGVIPTRAVEFMFLEFSIHRTGSNFTESTADVF